MSLNGDNHRHIELLCRVVIPLVLLLAAAADEVTTLLLDRVGGVALLGEHEAESNQSNRTRKRDDGKCDQPHDEPAMELALNFLSMRRQPVLEVLVALLRDD